MTAIWAHARSEGRPIPNLLTSFAEAVREGADGLELDVHQTADARLVCAHDAEVRDLEGGVWRIGDLAYADLCMFENPRAQGPEGRIPLLEEVYDLLRPTAMRLNIEAKNLVHRYPNIADTLVSSVAQSGMGDRVVISSFHHRLLQEIREQSTLPAVAGLFADGLIDPWEYFSHIGIREVHPHYSSLNEPGALDGFARAGIAVRAWTVNDRTMWATLMAAGIDAIITDFPLSAIAERQVGSRASVVESTSLSKPSVTN